MTDTLIEKLEAEEKSYKAPAAKAAMRKAIGLVRHYGAGPQQDTARGASSAEDRGEVPPNHRPDVEVPSLSPTSTLTDWIKVNADLNGMIRATDMLAIIRHHPVAVYNEDNVNDTLIGRIEALKMSSASSQNIEAVIGTEANNYAIDRCIAVIRQYGTEQPQDMVERVAEAFDAARPYGSSTPRELAEIALAAMQEGK